MAKKEILKPKIIHKMADGTISDSIEGLTVPFNPETYGVYKIVAEFADAIESNIQRREESA